MSVTKCEVGTVVYSGLSMHSLDSLTTKGSLTGNFFEPHKTECSRMCGIPVLSSGGVRKVIPNTIDGAI